MAQSTSLHFPEVLKPGEHLCCIYQTWEELSALAAALLPSAMQSGAKVIVHLHDFPIPKALASFRSQSPITRDALAKNQLIIRPIAEVCPQPGQVGYEKLLAELETQTETALQEGYSSVLFLNEMSLLLTGETAAWHALQFQASLNHLLSRKPVAVLSLFEPSRCNAFDLHNLLTTFPKILQGALVYRNPNFQPPELLLDGHNAGQLWQNWLQNTPEQLKEQGNQALYESQQDLTQITDSINLLLAQLDLEHRFLFVNQAFADWLGRSKEEWRGKHFWEAVDELAYQQSLPHFGTVLSGHKASFEIVAEDKEGQPRIIQVDFIPQLDQQQRVRSYILIAQDVTEYKQTQIALQISESHFRGIVEYQTELICRFLPDLTLTFVNEPFCRYFGCGRNELLGELFLPDIPEEDQERIRSLRKQISPENPIISYEHRLQRPDGQQSWLLWTEHGIFIDQVLVEYQAVGLDITGRKQMENALQQSEERLRMVISNLPVILFAVDKHGDFTLTQGKGFERFGLKLNALNDQSAFTWFRQRPEIGASIQRALTGESFSITFSIAGAVFETWCAPVRDEEANIQGMLGVAVDVTKRVHAENALRQSEERYRSLVENQGEGYIVFGAEFDFEYLNLAAEGIFGLPASQITQMHLHDFTAPRQKKMLRTHLENLKKGKGGTFELTILRPDKHQRHLLITANPRYNSEGSFIGSFTILRDITSKKQFEERLRYQSTHDALTGLYNRYYFEEEMKRLENSRHFPVSILLVDIDGLKEINDTYGHLAGDEQLRRLARVLRLTFRSEDMVARIGGDEFAVILPQTGKKFLDKSIQRLRSNLDASNQSEPNHPLKASIGGATTEPSRPLDRAFFLADQRMYREKRRKKAERLAASRATGQ